jgi:hypothetical protein
MYTRERLLVTLHGYFLDKSLLSDELKLYRDQAPILQAKHRQKKIRMHSLRT